MFNQYNLCIFDIFLIFLDSNCISGQYPYVSFDVTIDPQVSMKSLLPFTNFACGVEALCNVSNSRFTCPVNGFSCGSCSCDESCLRYGTCCLDVYEQYGDIPRGNRHARCVSAAFKTSLVVRTLNYTMIASCPGDKTTTSDNSFCANPDPDNIDHFVPVQGKISGIELTFRNKFCAHCHGLRDPDFNPWVVEYKCSGLVDYSQIRSESDYHKFVRSSKLCAVLLNPLDYVTSPCGYSHPDRSIISTCKSGFTERVRQACERMHHVVTNNLLNKSYKNEFCAYCNYVIMLQSNINACSNVFRYEILTAPLSVWFDIKRQPTPTITVQDLEECDTDKVYDTIEMYCRPIYCPAGMLILNHTCKDLVTSAFGVGYRLAYNVVATKRLKIPTRTYAKDIFVHNYIVNVNAVLAQLNLKYTSHSIRYSYKREGQFITVKNLTVYTKLIPANHKPRQLVEKLLNDVQKTTYYWYLDNDPIYSEVSMRSHILLDDIIDFPFRQWTYTSEEDQTEVRVMYSGSKLRDILPIYRVSDKYFRLVTELLSCPMILLNKSEFTVVSNDAILVDATNTTYQPGQYRLHNQQVYICTSFQGSYFVTRNKTITNPDLNIDYEEVILAIVCITLSLLGLAITLITYVLLPSLRTFPGKNNMVLFSIMFVAQLMFISTIRANVTKTICSVLGAVNHFIFLALFFWKSVCAFHMYRIFCQQIRYLSQTKWLFIYALYSFLCPLFIIGIYIVVNLTKSEWSQIGYGGSICFLSTPLGMGVAFALPVAVMLIANSVFFVCVILALKKTRQVVKDAITATNINNNMVYFKMSLLLGFTWAVGFVAAGTEVRVLRYLFSFLNSIIGLFICITYVFKGDVMKMLIKRFRCKRIASHLDSTRLSSNSAQYATKLTDTTVDNSTDANGEVKESTLD